MVIKGNLQNIFYNLSNKFSKYFKKTNETHNEYMEKKEVIKLEEIELNLAR